MIFINLYGFYEDLHFSEETYKRRKRNLIYTVEKELKKLTLNWPFYLKISGIISIMKKDIELKTPKTIAES